MGVDESSCVQVLQKCYWGFSFDPRSFAKSEITLSFTDVGKSCSSRKLFTSQICLPTLFVKLIFLQALNLQYFIHVHLPIYWI